jgi:hypothetical protein
MPVSECELTWLTEAWVWRAEWAWVGAWLCPA